MDVVLHELFLDGLLVRFAVGHVEAEVSPVFAGAAGPSPVGDGDGVADTEVHGLHDALPLQLPAGADGHGGRVAAGTDELLAVVVALLHVLQASPDGQAELLWDLQRAQVLTRSTQTGRVSRTPPHSRQTRQSTDLTHSDTTTHSPNTAVYRLNGQ